MDSFVTPSQEVVSEVIDGEAVIMDLRSGRYYTTDGVGAQVWVGATAGMPLSDIMTSCRTHFSAQQSAPDSSDHDIDVFLQLFVTAGLLVPAHGPAPSDSPVLNWPAQYSPPTVQCFDDLADMIAMDPVHDVGDAGWPWPAPTS